MPVAVKELVTSLGDVDFTTAEPDVEPIESFGLPELDWRFQPVWDVKREILSNWYVTPYLKQTQRRLPGYQFESVTARPQEFVAVDEAGLWVSERAIQELIEQGKQAVIGVSIHAGSLTNDAVRSRILAALDRLDQQFVRYRVIKVAGVIPGFPRLYLKQIVEALRARTPNVVIGAAWDEPDIAGLLHIGAVAVGATLPASVLEPTSSVSLQSVAAKLRADISRAHLAKTRFFVEGAIPASLARMMSALGVDNIASSRIWPTTETPDAMLRWPASGLVA